MKHPHGHAVYSFGLLRTEDVVSLEALSPLSILSRGYTLTETAEGRLIQHASEVKIGDTLRTRFDDGMIESQVKRVQMQ